MILFIKFILSFLFIKFKKKKWLYYFIKCPVIRSIIYKIILLFLNGAASIYMITWIIFNKIKISKYLISYNKNC